MPRKEDSALETHPWRNQKGLVLSIKNIWLSRTRDAITDYTLHPSPLYDKNTFQNDLMIIKLKSGVVLPPASPPPLLTSTNDLKGIFWARGFGGRKTPINSKEKKIIEKSRVLHLEFKWLEQNRLYFSHTGREATCDGDSGGMAYIERPNGSVELVSVISGVGRIKGNPETCSTRNYSIHTWLYPHLEWIKGLMEKN